MLSERDNQLHHVPRYSYGWATHRQIPGPILARLWTCFQSQSHHSLSRISERDDLDGSVLSEDEDYMSRNRGR